MTDTNELIKFIEKKSLISFAYVYYLCSFFICSLILEIYVREILILKIDFILDKISLCAWWPVITSERIKHSFKTDCGISFNAEKCLIKYFILTKGKKIMFYKFFLNIKVLFTIKSWFSCARTILVSNSTYFCFLENLRLDCDVDIVRRQDLKASRYQKSQNGGRRGTWIQNDNLPRR